MVIMNYNQPKSSIKPISKIMKQFLLIFSLFTLCNLTFGQNPENGQIRIKIDANVDGEKVKIDTSIDALSDFDIDGLLKELGLDEELSQLNIDINSGFNFEWDEQAFEEMMEGLQNIEMPEMPEMPVIPNLENLKELEFLSSNKAILGVYTDKVPEGAKITGLVVESGAIDAGLKEGDIITGIDAKTIESPNNLSEVIGMYEVGATIKVTFIRDGKTETVNAVLKENKNDFGNWSGMEGFSDSFNLNWDNNLDQLIEINAPTRGYLGVYLQDEEGMVKVSGVEDNSAAKEAGLMEGDIITELNGKKIITYDEMMEFMETTVPGEKIKISYERNGKKNTVDATLQEVKNMQFYFNGDDKEGSYSPNIIIDRIAPCPPGSAYSYNSGDGKRNINICITAIKNTDERAPSPNSNSAGAFHPLLEQNSVSVYSNPSDGTFNVKFNLPEAGDAKIVITDINGKEVYEETLMNFSGAYDKTITLSSEPKGTYFVKVTQNGYSNTKTVILQ